MTGIRARAPSALLLSPHPDDELMGCPAHIFALRDAGWRIVNLALSLGSRESRRGARRAELEDACGRAGFELVLEASELLPNAADRGGVPSPAAVDQVLALARSVGAELLVAPSPHDDHPAHEWTGRLAVAAMRAGAGRRLWLWGLWADLGMVSSMCAFGEARLAEIEAALGAHRGELERSDLPVLLRSRAQAAAVLLPERVFGYGSPGPVTASLAEGVCEIAAGAGGELWLCAPAIFDADGYGERPPRPASRIDGWLERPSARALRG